MASGVSCYLQRMVRRRCKRPRRTCSSLIACFSSKSASLCVCVCTRGRAPSFGLSPRALPVSRWPGFPGPGLQRSLLWASLATKIVRLAQGLDLSPPRRGPRRDGPRTAPVGLGLEQKPHVI